ncbi:hypothetical protein MKX03_023496, partial [Papaver bracteatum]
NHDTTCGASICEPLAKGKSFDVPTVASIILGILSLIFLLVYLMIIYPVLGLDFTTSTHTGFALLVDILIILALLGFLIQFQDSNLIVLEGTQGGFPDRILI